MRVFVDSNDSLACEASACAFSGIGHQVIRPDHNASPSQVQKLALQSDIIILDCVPTASSLTSDPARYRGILSALRHSSFVGNKRLILLSTTHCWSKLGVLEPNGKVCEADYKSRAPLEGFITQRLLEDEVMSMNGHQSKNKMGRLECCVIGCGVLVGLGEDLLLPLFCDAWLQKTIKLPYLDSQNVPTLRSRDLISFLQLLVQSPFPSPYLLAVNEECQGSTSSLAKAISCALGNGEIGECLQPAELASELIDNPSLLGAPSPVFSMKGSYFSQCVPHTLTPSPSNFNGYKGIASCVLELVEDFLVYRHLTPSRLYIASPPDCSDGEVIKAMEAKYQIKHINVKEAVKWVRVQGRKAVTAAHKAAKEAKLQAEAEAKAAAEAEAAAEAAEIAAAEGGEVIIIAKKNLEKAVEPVRPFREEEVMQCLKNHFSPVFSDVDLFHAIGGDKSNDGLPLPQAESLPDSLQLKCLRAMMIGSRDLRLKGSILKNVLTSRLDVKVLYSKQESFEEPPTSIDSDGAGSVGSTGGGEEPPVAAASAPAAAPAAAAPKKDNKKDNKKDKDHGPEKMKMDEGEAKYIARLKETINEPIEFDPILCPSKVLLFDKDVDIYADFGLEVPAKLVSYHEMASSHNWLRSKHSEGQDSVAEEVQFQKGALEKGLKEMFGDSSVIKIDDLLPQRPKKDDDESPPSDKHDKHDKHHDKNAPPPSLPKLDAAQLAQWSERTVEMVTSLSEGLVAACMLYAVERGEKGDTPESMMHSETQELKKQGINEANTAMPAMVVNSAEEIDHGSIDAGSVESGAENMSRTSSLEQRVDHEGEASIGKVDKPMVSLSDLTQDEKAYLMKRSAYYQQYLLKEVMPTLTHGMVICLKENPRDPITYLADFLVKEGKLVAKKAEAQAFLQFKGLVAKAKWFELMERAEEAEAARKATSHEDEDD